MKVPNKKKALVVEDENTNFLFLKEVLLELPLEVLHAKDGLQAIEICRQHPDIEVVFMDIKMPVMNGYEAFEKIRQFRPNLPVVAQTAHALEEDAEKIAEAGFDAYLPKPISRQKILSLMKRYLNPVKTNID